MANTPAILLPSEKRTGQPASKAAKALLEKGGLVSWLRERANNDDSDERKWEIAAEQLGSIFTADNINDMWMADMEYESQGGRDLAGVKQTIQSFTVLRSNKYKHGIPTGEAGEHFYLIVRAHEEGKPADEPLVWNTGAPLLIGKLIWLELHGLLGTKEARCVIVGTETANGSVLKLGPWPGGNGSAPSDNPS